ncbi:MAG: hypothetical protein ACI4MI_02905 [Christensenellales bacterium]
MGRFFKTKEEKELEKRMLVKKTMRDIEKHIVKLQAQKQKAVESAKQAKLQGSPQQYSLAVSCLRTALAQEKKAKEMLLNFQNTLQMRDLSQMTSEFLKGMSIVSKEMQAITKDMNFAKVQKEFETAMMGMENTTDNLDAMLDSTNDTFSAISSSNINIDDAEIEALIGNQASESEKELDNAIDKKLDEISKSLNGAN